MEDNKSTNVSTKPTEVGDWKVITPEMMLRAQVAGIRAVTGKSADGASIERLENGNYRFRVAQNERKPRSDKGTRRAPAAKKEQA